MTSDRRSTPPRGRKTSFSAACALLLLLPLPARADEPVGCDGFKWPLKQEAALLQAPEKPVISPGTLGKLDGKAYEL